MKKKLLTFASLGLGAVAMALAQQPQEGGPGGPPPGHGGEHGPPPMPLVEALDADHNHEISAEEIANAATALKTLDHDGDGKLTGEEFMPPPPPP
ncbi:MAG: EF-hand domain-containing protein, partial [Planctomycetota bacterium]